MGKSMFTRFRRLGRQKFLGSDRGEGRVGLIIAIVIAAIVLFLGVRIIPVQVRSYQFADYMTEEAQRTAWNKDLVTLRKHLLSKADSLSLPITDKQLDIKRTGGEIIIKAKYDVPVDLAITSYTFKFDQETRVPLF